MLKSQINCKDLYGCFFFHSVFASWILKFYCWMHTYLELLCLLIIMKCHSSFFCPLFLWSPFCLITVNDRALLCLLSARSILLVSANCVFNFNVYLLDIVPTWKRSLFHCLSLQTLGIKKQLRHSLLSGWGWIFNVPQHCLTSLSLLPGSQFCNNWSVVSFMPSCLAHSLTSIH